MLERIKLLLSIAIVLILLAYGVELLGFLVDTGVGLVGTLFSVAVLIYSNVRANRYRQLNPAYLFWRFVPILIFLVAPLIYGLWGGEGWSLEDLVFWTRITLGLALPVLLLLVVRLMVDRLSQGTLAESGQTTQDGR